MPDDDVRVMKHLAHLAYFWLHVPEPEYPNLGNIGFFIRLRQQSRST